MQPRSERPHFIRTLTRQKQKPELNPPKSRMLCLLLKRLSQNRLKSTINDIKKYGEKRYEIIGHALRRVDRNLEFCKLMAWRKVSYFVRMGKMGDHLVRFVGMAGDRVKNYQKLCGFRAIRKHGSRRCQHSIKVLQNSKTKFLISLLTKIQKRILSQPIITLKLQTLKSHLRVQKSAYIFKTLSFFLVRRMAHSWTKILSMQNSEHNDIEHELGELNKELNCLKRELARKDREIVELELELSSKKDKQMEEKRYYDKYSYNTARNDTNTPRNPYNNNSNNRSLENSRRSHKSIGSRRNSSQDISQKGSNQHVNFSVLSWLNGSFMSGKSGKSSMSRSITGLDCYCKYREKYNQYKAETTSLRNQLQIIKSQLQVTKDLNQHLQDQISNLCTNINPSSSPESELQLQLLRKQVKDLKKEKQTLKEKIIHNQKYIANLKCEFKNKIEGLYRNLRKGTSGSSTHININ